MYSNSRRPEGFGRDELKKYGSLQVVVKVLQATDEDIDGFNDCESRYYSAIAGPFLQEELQHISEQGWRTSVRNVLLKEKTMCQRTSD
ncbi:hypothetical protein TNCV_3805661 [Trichonephila clavipes]|nr:hypothetical protein TNCV_3805661 [Trichonephila clavipes]